MKIIALTRYTRLGASSRVRTLQYAPALEQKGFKIEVLPFLDDQYLIDLYSGRRNVLRTLGQYARRILDCIKAKESDLICIEKEALPWIPWLIERAVLPHDVPYVVDYDDSVFHRYDSHRSVVVRLFLGSKIDKVMAGAACVTVGNSYLESRAISAGAKRVERVPTVVDTNRYILKPKLEGNSSLRVGWIGTPKTWIGAAESTFRSLTPILAASGASFRAIGASLAEVTSDNLEIIPWTETGEVSGIQSFDIGVMPLVDDVWTRGKCGYKLLQYMACGLPVVASPIGINREIVQHGVNGFLADSADEWQKAVSILLNEPGLRRRMGEAGRSMVEERYSLQVWAPRLADIFRNASRQD